MYDSTKGCRIDKQKFWWTHSGLGVELQILFLWCLKLLCVVKQAIIYRKEYKYTTSASQTLITTLISY